MKSFYANHLKRPLDVVLAVLAIVVLLLPMLVIALIIRMDNQGPAMFQQERSGRNRVPFKIFKFRSMPVSIPKNLPTNAVKNPSLTRWQQWIRKASIDELPQVFNILKGEMSFVGPRPVIPNETYLLDEREKYGANAVRPGLTGWAQINGRDHLDHVTKARLDGEYAARISFRFDMLCLFRTFFKVVTREDVRH